MRDEIIAADDLRWAALERTRVVAGALAPPPLNTYGPTRANSALDGVVLGIAL